MRAALNSERQLRRRIIFTPARNPQWPVSASRSPYIATYVHSDLELMASSAGEAVPNCPRDGALRSAGDATNRSNPAQFLPLDNDPWRPEMTNLSFRSITPS